MEGEEAGIIPEVVEEGSQCSREDEDSDRSATPTVKIGEKRLICRGNGAVGKDGKTSQGLAFHGDVSCSEQAGHLEGLQGRWSETHFLVEGPDS